MSWRMGFLVKLMGCAPDTVAPGRKIWASLRVGEQG